MKGGSLLVKGGRVFTPDGFIEDGAVLIIDGRIAFVGRSANLASAPEVAPLVLEASEATIAPGLLDVHTHGGGGVDVMSADSAALHTIAKVHAMHGTTGLLAGTSTEPHAAIVRAANAIAEAVAASQTAEWEGAQVLGMHLEGPYSQQRKRGAMNPAYLRSPDHAELQEILDVLGQAFRLITMAPEMPGAIEIIRWLSEQGVRVSLGHSVATYETCLAAIAAGARHATHIFNGMVPLHHREPGLVAAVLGRDEVTAELVADGIHVHPGAMRVVWRAKGAERICLITDAIAALDMPPGRYTLSGMAIDVRDGACRLAGTDTLAGSILTMDRAIKNAVEKADIPLADALTMATATPAREMGVADRKGALREHLDGDLCLLGPDLLCCACVIAGRIVKTDPNICRVKSMD